MGLALEKVTILATYSPSLQVHERLFFGAKRIGRMGAERGQESRKSVPPRNSDGA